MSDQVGQTPACKLGESLQSIWTKLNQADERSGKAASCANLCPAPIPEQISQPELYAQQWDLEPDL